MSTLKPCISCSAPIRAGTCTCPNCGASACAKTSPSAAVLLLGLALAGCKDDGGGDVALYGVAFIDEDQDGYEEGVDCDDTDPDVNPDAEEIPGDGVDSNCDQDDDT